MPGAHDEELGRRLFITNREKAVEDAIRKIRNSLGHSWDVFSPSDIADLSWILGELWVGVNRGEWATYAFSRLTRNDIDTLVAIVRKTGKNHGMDPGSTRDAKEILQKTL